MAGDALQPLYRDEANGHVVDGIQPWADVGPLTFPNGITTSGLVLAAGTGVTGGVRNIISATTAGAGPTALAAAQSRSLVIFDRAAGAIFSLPAAPAPGLEFDFYVAVSDTSNSYKVVTGAGTELLVGSLVNVDTDSANAVAAWTGNGSTHISVDMTAAGTNAKGGLVGTWLRFTALTATLWLVTGIVQGAGTVATPFATS